MDELKRLSGNTRAWLQEQGLEGKRLRRAVTRRIYVPEYTKVQGSDPWQPSGVTRFATGDDVEKILKAVRTAYAGKLDREYPALKRLEHHIRANEVARAAGYEPAFVCLRERSPDELIFMVAEIRRYRKTRREYFDIEYFWIYEWVSTIRNDSGEVMAMLKDLRRFYGHICSRAGRPLNVRTRTHKKTSHRIRDRMKRTLEGELARRGMESTFKVSVRKRKGQNTYLSANNSLNAEMDAWRRKEVEALQAEAPVEPS
ncbi:hypothetical protein ABI59_21970 [Acidobacteria bacterium Mor1]|nr:hypothetical protein ABI59_21970 [Acidobacteria bacterium Mor1]